MYVRSAFFKSGLSVRRNLLLEVWAASLIKPGLASEQKLLVEWEHSMLGRQPAEHYTVFHQNEQQIYFILAKVTVWY